MKRVFGMRSGVCAAVCLLVGALAARSAVGAEPAAGVNKTPAAGVEADKTGDAGAAAGTNAFQWSWDKDAEGKDVPGGKPRAGISPAAYEKLVKDNLELRKKVDQMSQDYDTLKRSNAALILHSEDLEQKRQALAASVKDVKGNSELEAELSKVRAQNATLQDDLAKVRKDLEAKTAAVPAAPKEEGPAGPTPQPGSDLFRKLEKENADLRSQIEKWQQAHQDVSQKKAQIEDKGAQLESDMARAAGEKAELEKDMESLQGSQAQYRQVVRDVARKALRYKEEADDLKKQLAETQTELRATRRAVDILQTAMRKGITAEDLASGRGGAVVSEAAQSQKDALFNKAIAFTKAGKYDSAEKAYQLVLRMDPASTAAHFNLGVLYGDYMDQPKNAIAQYRSYLDLSPSAKDSDIVRSWIVEQEMKAAISR